MYHFIVNATSRTGRAESIWSGIKSELEIRGVEYRYYITNGPTHANRIVAEISAKNEGVINLIVVGGDGTANEVINGITDLSKVRFGYIPTGSGNDLARGLGINKRKPIEQLAHILKSDKVLKMDLGEVITEEGIKRRFAISAGIGVDASVCKQALTSRLKKVLNKLGIGSATYVLLTIKTMFTMPLCDGVVTLDDGIVKTPHNIIFCAAMNHPWEGGGVPMAPNADATDGQLSVCCVSDIRRAKCFVSLAWLMVARHDKIPGFDIYNCRSAKIELEDRMVVHADGEYVGEVKSIEFRCISGALSVII